MNSFNENIVFCECREKLIEITRSIGNTKFWYNAKHYVLHKVLKFEIPQKNKKADFIDNNTPKICNFSSVSFSLLPKRSG